MEVRNKFTEACNVYLLPEYKKHMGVFHDGTYLLLDGETGGVPMNIPFRFPGATRGHVTVDLAGEITDVVFYSSAYVKGVGCYSPDIENLKEDCLGWNVI